MKPGKERMQREIAADFGRTLHACLDRFMGAMASGDPGALQRWRQDLEALIEALAVAAHAMHPLAIPDAHELRKRLRAAMHPAGKLAGFAQYLCDEERRAIDTMFS